MTIVTVVEMGNKTVNTKFGAKQTYSFKGDDGAWYKGGFDKPVYSVGSVVEFDFAETTYGKEVVKGTLKVAPQGAGQAALVPGVKIASLPPYSGGSNKGVFPIPALDGQRSIIRQNALTNARELVLVVMDHTALTLDEVVDQIIFVARQFEAYSAGDLDMAAAMEKAVA